MDWGSKADDLYNGEFVSIAEIAIYDLENALRRTVHGAAKV